MAIVSWSFVAAVDAGHAEGLLAILGRLHSVLGGAGRQAVVGVGPVLVVVPWPAYFAR